MKPILALHQFMKEHYPRTLRDEVLCTCGAGNHVRLRFFRIDAQPASVVLPEGFDLSAEQLKEHMGGARVEKLTDEELEAAFAETELGRTLPFENPFGTAVYFDEGLLAWKELVFCPRMFGGERGECFRAPTRDFLTLTRAIVLPLSGAAMAEEKDAWAV